MNVDKVMQKTLKLAQSQLNNYKVAFQDFARDAVVTDPRSAFNELKFSIQQDQSFAWSWHCNVAMASYDEGVDHATANKAAARFMQSCFGVDTSKFKEYLAFGEK